MYHQILNTSNASNLDIFDGRTGDFIGHAHLRLSSDSERKRLNLINCDRAPDARTLLDVRLSPPSINYIPAEIFRKLSAGRFSR